MQNYSKATGATVQFHLNVAPSVSLYMEKRGVRREEKKRPMQPREKEKRDDKRKKQKGIMVILLFLSIKKCFYQTVHENNFNSINRTVFRAKL